MANVFGKTLDFLNSAGERLGGGLARDIVRAPKLLTFLKPFTPDSVDQRIQGIANASERSAQGTFGEDTGITNKNTAARVGAQVGSVVKGAADVAQLALPTDAIGDAVSGLSAVQKLADAGEAGSTVAKVGGKVLPFLAGSAAGSVIQSAQDVGQGKDVNVGKNIATGVVTDVGTAALGKWGGAAYQTIKKALGKDVASTLARTTDEGAAAAIIKKVLPELDDGEAAVAAKAAAGQGDRTKIVDSVAQALTDTSQPVRDKALSIAPQASRLAPTPPGPLKSTAAIDNAVPTEPGAALEQVKGLMKTSKQAVDEAAPDVTGLAKFRGKVAAKAQSLNEQVFDKMAPLKSLQDQIEQATGNKLPIESRPYDLARLHAGLPEAVGQKINGLDESLKSLISNGVDINDLNAYGAAQRVVNDRSGISSFVSPETAQKALGDIATKYTPEQQQALKQTYDGFIQHNQDLLGQMHDSGLISDGAFKAIQDKNTSYYSPFQLVQNVVDDIENGGSKFGRGSSFNVAKQALIKSQSGMEEGSTILNPLEATISNTEKVMKTVSKNNVGNAIGKLSDLAPDVLPKLRNVDDVTSRAAMQAEASQLRPIRDSLYSEIQKQGQKGNTLQKEINAMSLEFAKKARSQDVGAFAKSGDGDAAAALRDITSNKDLREMYQGLLDAPDAGFKRIQQKVLARNKDLSSVFDTIENMRGDYNVAKSRVSGLVSDARALADKEVPEGYSRISYFNKGVREDVAIPNELNDVYKGLGKNQADIVSNFISQTSRIMKSTATSLNLPFVLIKNPIRDFKSMALNSENTPLRDLASKWVQGLSSAIHKDDYYKAWVDAGGSGAGIYRESADEAQKLIDKHTLSTGEKIGKLVKSPADLLDLLTTPIRKVGEAIEGAPRLAEFRSALEGGKTAQEAALAARDVTVDFAKSGKTGQIANMWVPFLNARLQGAERLATSFKKNPSRALTVYTGLTALPIVATYAYNYENHKDTLAKIPQSVKDGNFVIVYGDATDKHGNPTQVAKIPKGELDTIFGNPLENFVSYLFHNDPKSAKQVALETLSNISPQSFVKDGEVNASRALSGLPPAIRVPVENATNHNLYNDQQIVPTSLSALPNDRQVKPDTSLAARVLGGITGSSPLKAENTVRGFTGNAISSNPLTDLKSQVLGANGSAAQNDFYKVQGKTAKLRAAASQDINAAIADKDYSKAQQIAANYNDQLKAAFKPWAKKHSAESGDTTLATSYNDQKIKLTRSSIAQRRHNILVKQRKTAGAGV